MGHSCRLVLRKQAQLKMKTRQPFRDHWIDVRIVALGMEAFQMTR
jgi:hypothetical protein